MDIYDAQLYEGFEEIGISFLILLGIVTIAVVVYLIICNINWTALEDRHKSKEEKYLDWLKKVDTYECKSRQNRRRKK